MGKVVAVVCYIGGALMLFFGMVFVAISFTFPAAVGGFLFDIWLAYCGHRRGINLSGREKLQEKSSSYPRLSLVHRPPLLSILYCNIT
jgi:hypothetical protein